MRDMKMDAQREQGQGQKRVSGSGSGNDVSFGVDGEDGKERTIAKAALSIAELGEYFDFYFILFSYVRVYST